jgi:hypothetical protein
LPLRISRRACVLGAPFLSSFAFAAAVKRPGKRRRFRGLSFFLAYSRKFENFASVVDAEESAFLL